MRQHCNITWRLLFLLAATIGWSIAIYAQTVTGTLQGTVTDTTGAVVPGAEVVVRNMETGQERNLKTNNDGVYTATFLPLGLYNVTASGQGFRTPLMGKSRGHSIPGRFWKNPPLIRAVF